MYVAGGLCILSSVSRETVRRADAVGHSVYAALDQAISRLMVEVALTDVDSGTKDCRCLLSVWVAPVKNQEEATYLVSKQMLSAKVK